MGKPKKKLRTSASMDNDESEDDSHLQSKARRRPKLPTTTKKEDTDSESETSPAPKIKAVPKPRKKSVGHAAHSPANSTEAPDTNLAPHLRKRKGGNKRRFNHEYCLTCHHYGRACSGRREDQEGCSVCREPNREKGEKLRECLWARPEANINTYEEARAAHKEAQTERRAREKAKTQELKRANGGRPSSNFNNPAHMVGVNRGSPPPVNRQLDVVPPPSAMNRPPSFFSHHDIENRKRDSDSRGCDGVDTQNHIDDTVAVDTSSTSRLPGINGEPGPRIHKPKVINLKLRLKYPSAGDGNYQPQPLPAYEFPRPDQQLPPSSRPLSFAPPPIEPRSERLPKERPLPPPIPPGPPYYDYAIQAWRYPSQPGPYITPADIPSSSRPVYQSAYGFAPAFTESTANDFYQPYVEPPSTPLTNRIKVRPLDRSGTPCKKWARTGSDVTTMSGYAIKMQKWKAESTEVDEGAIMDDEADRTRDDISTSDLSSVIDVDDPGILEKAVRDTSGLTSSPASHSSDTKDEPGYIMVNGRDNTTEELKEECEEDDEDRLVTQINRMAREAEKKFTTQAKPVPAPPKPDVNGRPKIIFRTSNAHTTNNLLAPSDNNVTYPTNTHTTQRDTEEESSDESGTDDDGPLKRLPLEIRNKLSRTATTHIRISETETITIRPEHFKGESLRERSNSTSTEPPAWTASKQGQKCEGKREKRRHTGASVDASDATDEDNDEGIAARSESQDVDMEDI